MASNREVFGLEGPTFLTAVDWHNPHHRRSIAASLVAGVYILEHDHQQNRQGPHALAPPWWEFFGFRLIHVLVDDHDLSYFGALFEFTLSCPPRQNNPGQRPPQYVMAFRGTIIKDMEVLYIFERFEVGSSLHPQQSPWHYGSRRFQIGMESTGNIISRAGPQNIWLAGHSLGSYIALLIGRRMAKNSGFHLESYLFNPPFISAPLQRLIKSEKIRFGLRIANSVLTAGIAAAVSGAKNQRTQDNDPFVGLSTWVPYLFVNAYDPISCEYAGYFEHREKMEAVGMGRIGKLATKHSIGCLVLGHAKGIESEAVHLIPSANLTTNISPCRKFKEAHGIQQWWRPDLELVYKLYQYQ